MSTTQPVHVPCKTINCADVNDETRPPSLMYLTLQCVVMAFLHWSFGVQAVVRRGACERTLADRTRQVPLSSITKLALSLLFSPFLVVVVADDDECHCLSVNSFSYYFSLCSLREVVRSFVQVGGTGGLSFVAIVVRVAIYFISAATSSVLSDYDDTLWVLLLLTLGN